MAELKICPAVVEEAMRTYRQVRQPLPSPSQGSSSQSDSDESCTWGSLSSSQSASESQDDDLLPVAAWFAQHAKGVAHLVRSPTSSLVP